jgi:hypothetical protein
MVSVDAFFIDMMSVDYAGCHHSKCHAPVRQVTNPTDGLEISTRFLTNKRPYPQSRALSAAA